jgi:hypothetical protein
MAAETANTPTLEQQEPSRTKVTNIIAGSTKQIATMMPNGKEPRQELKAAGPNKIEEGKCTKPNDKYEDLKPVGNGNNQYHSPEKPERAIRQLSIYHHGGNWSIKSHDKDTEVYRTCDNRIDAIIEAEQEEKENNNKQPTLNVQPPYIIRRPRKPPKPPPIRPKPPWTAKKIMRASTKTCKSNRLIETSKEKKEDRTSKTKYKKQSISNLLRHQTCQNNNSYLRFHNDDRVELVVRAGSRPEPLQADPTHPAPKLGESCKPPPMEAKKAPLQD